MSGAVTILRAHDGRRLTKRFTPASNGVVVRQDYDKATWFSAERVRVAGIHDLHRLLIQLEPDTSACIIRGKPVPGADLARTRRRKLENSGAFAEVPRSWAMLDLDGIPLPAPCSVLEDPQDAARVLLDILVAHAPELEGVSAVVQFSSSAGLDELAAAAEAVGLPNTWRGVAKAGVSAHVWIWLQEPLGEAALLRWRESIAAAGLPLDPATLRTVQPHYTAAPVFDATLRDPLAGRRTVLLEGSEDAAALIVPEPQACAAGGASGNSAYAGRGYRGQLADIGPDGFHAPVLRAVAAYVASNWPSPDLAALKDELRRCILAADPGGRSPAEIADRASDRHLNGAIVWVMQREAAKRAAQAEAPPEPAIDPTFPDQGVLLAVAQVRMAEALTDYARQLRAGTALDLLLRVTVGGGKSQAAILAAPVILAAARQAKPEGALFYLTPRHDLNEELRQRFADAHPGLRVALWRGMDADDPTRQGRKMCLDPELPQAAADAGLARTTPCGACTLKGECGYRQQGAEGADIWLAAHNLAFGGKPGVLPDAAGLILDESITGAALAGMDALHPIELALSELLDTRTGAVTGLARDRLLFLRRRVYDALQWHGEGGMLREVFAATGLTADSAKEWQELEWQVKPQVELTGDMPRDAILEQLRQARTAGFRKLRPTLARYLRELLDSDAARSVNVTVAPGGATLRFAWREDFAKWTQVARKLFLDGTSHPDLLRVWSPDVQVVDVEVAAPHQRVRQVPREFGRRFFTGNPENVRRLADLVVVELASTNGDVLVVAQQAVLDLLRAELLRPDPPRFASGKLPTRLHLAHHGAVTGMNRWQNVERALIVGRPAVNRRDGERLAEVSAGAPVAAVADQDDNHWPTVTAGIRMADGTGAPVQQARHPDRLVEASRWSISEGAILQAIGRARGVRRGAARPVQVTVLAAMALPLTVQEVMSWETMQPDWLNVAAAEAALNGRALPLAAADLHQARPDLWKTPKAAERFLEQRRRTKDAQGKTPKALIKSPYKGFGGFAPLTLARYRKVPTGGRWSLALVPPKAGQATLEAEVGPLAAYEAIPPPAPAAAPRPSPPPPEAPIPELPSAAAPSPPGAEQAGLHPAAFGLHRVGLGFPQPLTVPNGLTVHLRPSTSPLPLRIWEIGQNRLRAEVRHVR